MDFIVDRLDDDVALTVNEPPFIVDFDVRPPLDEGPRVLKLHGDDQLARLVNTA